jgi:hypothetical protein
MNGRRIALHFSNWLRQLFRAATNTLTMDWRTNKTYFFAGLLLLLTTFVVVVYYVNNPQPFVGPDSFEYIANAQRIATHGQFVDPHRLPGFPLLIALVFALAGQGNMMAISIANGVLFILATLEIYVISLLVLQRRWLAFFLGLLVGTNVVLLSFVKPIGSEALALWLVVTLALVAVLFARTLRIRYLWLVMACMLTLILTRLEWTYLPVPLFAYLVLVATRQGSTLRRPFLHALSSVFLIYAVLGGYIFINATQNHFVGISDIQNINTLGKVIQYNMQNEALPQYAAIAQTTNTFRSHGDINPYDLLGQHPELKNNHFALVGAYAQSVIEHHPVEFLAKSVPVLFSSLDYFYYESEVDPHGLLARPLFGMNFVFHVLYKLNLGFPLVAAAWIFLLFWRRTTRLLSVQAMGIPLLVVLYGIVMTTLGGYSSYIRFHTPFNPLLIVILWGGVLAGLLLIVRPGLPDSTPEVSTAPREFVGRT